MTFGSSFWKKGSVYPHTLMYFQIYITMIAKVCARESRRATWFENRLVVDLVEDGEMEKRKLSVIPKKGASILLYSKRKKNQLTDNFSYFKSEGQSDEDNQQLFVDLVEDGEVERAE